MCRPVWVVVAACAAIACVDLTPPARVSSQAPVDAALPADRNAGSGGSGGNGPLPAGDGPPAVDLGSDDLSGAPDSGPDLPPNNGGASGAGDGPSDAAGGAGPPDLPPLKSNGAACAAGGECSSGICADQVCCDSTCTGTCESCVEANQTGTCSPVPDGSDPAQECAQDAATTCNQDGSCNGARACRKYSTGTGCGPATCSSGTESQARSCDGKGACLAPITRACAPYLCGLAACAVSCTTPADCSSGASCIGAACVATQALQLYWSFDEASGALANDSSGQGHNGQYGGGVQGPPSASALVPALQFGDPRSRSFTAPRMEVRLRNLPPALLPASNVTLAAWFRATAIADASGYGEIISVADGLALYLKDGVVGFGKRLGNQSYVGAEYSTTGHLDGKWHHVAGVFASPGGLTLFFDGVARATLPGTTPVAYGPTSDFLVGADMDPFFGAYFNGQLDEIRLYSRALPPAEVMGLAAGGR